MSEEQQRRLFEDLGIALAFVLICCTIFVAVTYILKHMETVFRRVYESLTGGAVLYREVFP